LAQAELLPSFPLLKALPKRDGMPRSARFGRGPGLAFALLATSVLGLTLVELALHCSGLWDASRGVLARRLQMQLETEEHVHEHEHGHGHEHEHENGEPDWMLIDLLIRLCVLVLVTVVSTLELWLYWRFYIKPTPSLYVPARVIVPDDLKGRWQYGMFDCQGAWGTFCCFFWCTPCAVADLWYRAGWIHASLGRNVDTSPELSCCPGWPWFLGVCGYLIAQDMAGGCDSCVYSLTRGGLVWVNNDPSLGEVETHALRFGMPHKSCGDFCCDCCLWLWCRPCIATQEYRQIMALLDRRPLQVQQPAMPTCVGMPMQVAGGQVQPNQPAMAIPVASGVTVVQKY